MPGRCFTLTMFITEVLELQKKRYQNLQGETSTEFLLGTSYIIVDDNFSRYHKMAKAREACKRQILVSFGGGDAQWGHSGEYFTGTFTNISGK